VRREHRVLLSRVLILAGTYLLGVTGGVRFAPDLQFLIRPWL
jgi:hypothetical protein